MSQDSDPLATFRWDIREHLTHFLYLCRWFLLILPVAAAIGSAVAFFLWSLNVVTTLRLTHFWLLYLLPVFGVIGAALYHYLGGRAGGGNDLLINQIHKPGAGVPGRMAPLILAGTLLTHFGGGSSGREGTAVQMGGSFAGMFARAFRLKPQDVSILLMGGVAAGFGAVFGTPIAGGVFALEVLTIGQMNYRALLPCLIASIVGDQTCHLWGIRHEHFQILSLGTDPAVAAHAILNPRLLGYVVLASIAFGLAGTLFAEAVHSVQRTAKVLVKYPVLRPLIGGSLVIGLVYLFGIDYLGLGVRIEGTPANAVTIGSCFGMDGAGNWSWLLKILFTAMTLGWGFKGGEVTPLFFVGAALGNVLARLFGIPEYTDLFAGLGFVAVFTGAANTPLAGIIMGLELFGTGPLVYLSIACGLAYLFSGYSGIYLAQGIGTAKGEEAEKELPGSLEEAREHRVAVLPWLRKKLK